MASKQIFGTAQEVRNYLVGFGFAPLKKGLTCGEFVANGRKARFGLYLTSKTGQSSKGAGASWGYVVTVEPA